MPGTVLGGPTKKGGGTRPPPYGNIDGMRDAQIPGNKKGEANIFAAVCFAFPTFSVKSFSNQLFYSLNHLFPAIL